MSTSLPLLVEIGVEELPSSFVDAALVALPALVTAMLAELRLPHGSVSVYGTPRRLAFCVNGLPVDQPDRDEDVVGPPEAVAFRDGKPTQAAEAFASKLGIAVGDLTIASREAGPKQKPGKYVIGRRLERGQPTQALLGSAITDLCARIPFRKSMRWGAGSASFGRPVQWIVALLGPQVIDLSFAGVASGNQSRGHRFLAPGEFVVRGADTYVQQLRDAHVIVDRDERVRVMMERVAAAASDAGGTFDPEPALVSENASLVEEPHILTGSFDPALLSLPAAVIRSVARGHQRYFCVQKDADTLEPKYVAVVNTANKPELVIKGMDRVMRARLADARFFFEEDKKTLADARIEKLKGIVFHHRLGSVHDKVTRLQVVGARIAEKLAMNAATTAHVARATQLCKTDLVSLMVGEFPELQGEMGRAYALHAGEDPIVADAIRDHYRPAGASDSVAPSEVAAVVALADRLDTLTGCFAVGLSPSGTADPYALRRACLGVLRTLIEKGLGNPAYARLSLRELIESAYGAFGAKPLDVTGPDTVQRVLDFASERLRGVLTGIASSSVAEAILAGAPKVNDRVTAPVEFPVYAVVRATALQPLVDAKAAWLDKARVVAKRLSGISKESKPVLHPPEALGETPARIIAEVVRDLDHVTRALETEAAVRHALESTEALAIRVDDIFTNTLVNDPNDPSTPKRLEVLSYGAACMLRIADFSRLA